MKPLALCIFNEPYDNSLINKEAVFFVLLVVDKEKRPPERSKKPLPTGFFCRKLKNRTIKLPNESKIFYFPCQVQQLNKMHISDMRCRDDVWLIDVQTVSLPVQSSGACDANPPGWEAGR